jgi:hypothetical protein
MALSGLQVSSYVNLGSAQVDPLLATWTLLPCVRTESLDMSPMDLEANCRNLGGYQGALTGLIAGTVTNTYLFGKTDTGFLRIKNDVLLGTKSQYAIMFDTGSPTTAPSGAEGFISVMNVSQFEINRDYDSAVEVTITLKPYPNDIVLPFWWTKA